MLLFPSPVLLFYIFFLDFRTVFKQNPCKIYSRRSCIDFAFESLFMKLRNQSAVIDMCVGEQDEIDLFGVKKEWLIIEFHDLFGSLEHSTVYKKFTCVCFDEIT